ncbi:tRNA-modifying protein YgfZ [Rosenbergiella australiborealis]|uniref:tRNA-modifying protein YgfZ n=1 Tax=Rosenbergiella australiborealis TaxID=1544696 RepID=UPI001F4D4B70|nr:tRNA-modifying protein YgfZ [Rosenbergiella australiborealis]
MLSQPDNTVTHADLVFCALTDWALVTAQGADATAYLQGQLTADLSLLPEHSHQLAAHCDAKGKMWSNLRIFHEGEGYCYLLRRSVREQQLTELKKYAVFSKVTLAADDSRAIIGVMGQQATAVLQQHFAQLPDATHPLVKVGTSILLWLATPENRYIVIAEPATAQALLNHAPAAVYDQQLWLAAEIAAGIPVIDSANSAQFIPQAANLQALGAISFKKGCYSGQEMVARAKYRGANKRALYWLSGSAMAAIAPGEAVELQMGDNWRKTGTVLCSVMHDERQLWVQVILNNDLDSEHLFRREGETESELRIQPLPYSLDDA